MPVSPAATEPEETPPVDIPVQIPAQDPQPAATPAEDDDTEVFCHEDPYASEHSDGAHMDDSQL
eukprot:3584382-Pyramimonas_sp.AAC.1